MSDMTRGELIEKRIDREVAATVNVGNMIGGLRVSNMLEVMELSKLMSISGQAVPPHCRNNPGLCLAVLLSAIEWNMSPFSVANKTYVVNDRLNYESQLVHAVIEARAPLRERLKQRFEGEGDERVCIVSGTFRGEVQPREHRSPPLKIARQGGKSPLWQKKPDVQLFYDTSRDFCRIYCPETLLGIYTPDEVEQYGIGDTAKDVTPESAALSERLAKGNGSGGEGYHPEAVERAMPPQPSPPVREPTPPPPPQAAPKRKPGRPRRPVEPEPEQAPAEPPPVEAPPDMPPPPQEPQPEPPGVAAESAPAVPVRKVPCTVLEYANHLETWLRASTSEEDIDARWKAEITLRNKCGLVEEERRAMLAWLADRKAELQRAP